MTRTTRVGMWLLLLTAALVAAGCVLFVNDSVGWAQMFWVLGSGTAGASAAIFAEHRTDHPPEDLRRQPP